MTVIKVRNISHRDQDRIGLFFAYDEDLISRIKEIPGRRYSETLKCWHLPDTLDMEEHILNLERNWKVIKDKDYESHHKATYGENAITEQWLVKLTDYEEYLNVKRYSAATIQAYISIMKVFLAWLQQQDIQTMDKTTLLRFNHEYFIKKGYSKSYQNIGVNAMKLFFEKFTEYEFDYTLIERPRNSSYLPTVLSVTETQRFINGFSNLKHKAIMMTIYACGLRKSEVVNLKLNEVDGDRNVVRIRNSKGAKNRDVPLPDMLKSLLRAYYAEYQPKVYLFNGAKGEKYSTSSIDKLIKKGVKQAGIQKNITTHSLRHSYATHLVEKNVNLRYIQEALGHKSSRTTEIYTRLSKDEIANMVSPIDFWKI